MFLFRFLRCFRRQKVRRLKNLRQGRQLNKAFLAPLKVAQRGLGGPSELVKKTFFKKKKCLNLAQGFFSVFCGVRVPRGIFK